MRSITIHGIDTKVDALIRDIAKQNGISINKTIKRLLEEALGFRPVNKSDRADYEDLFGVWSKDDVREFQKSIDDLVTINEEDWCE